MPTAVSRTLLSHAHHTGVVGGWGKRPSSCGTLATLWYTTIALAAYDRSNNHLYISIVSPWRYQPSKRSVAIAGSLQSDPSLYLACRRHSHRCCMFQMFPSITARSQHDQIMNVYKCFRSLNAMFSSSRKHLENMFSRI